MIETTKSPIYIRSTGLHNTVSKVHQRSFLCHFRKTRCNTTIEWTRKHGKLKERDLALLTTETR